MTEPANPNENPGGDPAENAGGSGNGGANNGTVAYETYRKTVDEAKALKKQLKEISERMNLYEGEKRAQEEKLKLDQNQHLEVIGDLKKQLEQANAKIQESESQWTDYRKMNAAVSLLQQKGVNFDPKYAHLIDLSEVSFDSSGNIDTASVAKAVDNFQKEHPLLAQLKKPDLPGGKSGGSGPLISYDEWSKLTLNEQKARFKDIKQ